MGGPSEDNLKMREEVAAFVAGLKTAPLRRADSRFAARVLSLWDARRERGDTLLFVPTIGAAITAERPFLTFHCPACRVHGRVDLRKQDRHPQTPVTSLIPSLSCQRCTPNPPFAKLDGLEER
jgi:hypothetical protein